jgi:hypothetical protein
MLSWYSNNSITGLAKTSLTNRGTYFFPLGHWLTGLTAYMFYVFQPDTTRCHRLRVLAFTTVGRYSIPFFDESTSNITGLPSVTRFNVPPPISYLSINSAWVRFCGAQTQDNLLPARLHELVYIYRLDKYSKEQRDMRITPGQG